MRSACCRLSVLIHTSGRSLSFSKCYHHFLIPVCPWNKLDIPREHTQGQEDVAIKGTYSTNSTSVAFVEKFVRLPTRGGYISLCVPVLLLQSDK